MKSVDLVQTLIAEGEGVSIDEVTIQQLHHVPNRGVSPPVFDIEVRYTVGSQKLTGLYEASKKTFRKDKSCQYVHGN